MGWWAEHVVPRVVDRALSGDEVDAVRVRACRGLSGRVLEIGFGSGLNLYHYPPGVTEVSAVEPADVGWRLARSRVASSSVPVLRAGLDGQRLELHFAEHGLSPDPRVARWQHRLEPLQRAAFGGCHLTRPVADLVTEQLELESRPFGYLDVGTARRAR